MSVLTPEDLARGRAVVPQHTQRHHTTPPWKGDRIAEMAVVGRLPRGHDGVRAADVNLQWYWKRGLHGVAGEAFANHYAAPGKDNWTHIEEVGGVMRPLTKTELRRAVWDAEDVARWARRLKGGGWEHPATYRQMAAAAIAHGARVIGELKSAAFALPAVASYMVREAAAVGHPPWFMALFGSMKLCKQKCSSIIGAGGQFVVIFGRASLTRRWRPVFRARRRSWAIQPTAVG